VLTSFGKLSVFALNPNGTKTSTIKAVINLAINKHNIGESFTHFSTLSVSRRNKIYVVSDNQSGVNLLHVLEYRRGQFEYQSIWEFIQTNRISNNLMLSSMSRSSSERTTYSSTEFICAYDLDRKQYNIFMWPESGVMERKVVPPLEHIGGFS
jgi:hypothetical protein